MLAETNRAPFDLPEAEAELVAGYNVEYGSMAFALFFLGEYSSMLLMASFLVILFFGGWLFPFFEVFAWFNFISPFIFAIKITFFAFCYILVRAAFPRYRYDQLMDIG
jgi:NADH-quinone oxidoreductase subunit H